MEVFEQVARKFSGHLTPESVGEFAFGLSAYSWSLVIGLLFTLSVSLLAWWMAVKMTRKNSRYSSFFLYLYANVIYLVIGTALLLLIGKILGYFSLFWLISLIFYGNQVFLPAFLLIHAFKNPKYQKLPSALHSFGIIFSLLTLIVSFYAFFIEPFHFEITSHEVSISQEPLRLKVVHITDIQTDYLGKKEKNLVEKVNALRPDLILITGDYFNGGEQSHPRAFRSARYVLKNLEAKYGVYGVSSDSNLPESHFALFEGLEATWLENQSVEIGTENGKFTLIGLSRDNPDLAKSWADVDPTLPKILLYHGPEIFFAPEIIVKNPELILVGHTHGGQVALPIIGPVTSATPYGGDIARGWFEKEGVKMYVNRGIGLEGNWAPRIRFLTRPEIAILEI